MATYRQALRELQVRLVTVQRHLIERGHRVLVIFEGRDASGKDGVIRRITEHLSPRDTRVVALGKPSDREQSQWYFQRFTAYLPAAGEFVIFNRSWYNRAGVERVMGYCSEADYESFMQAVVPFEVMLVKDGLHLIKYYLDITRDEQEKRLDARARDPLRQWKISPVDSTAIGHWHDYSQARDKMLAHTSHAAAPWVIVRADDKKTARLNVLCDLLTRVESPGQGSRPPRPDHRVVFKYEPRLRSRLAR